MDFKVKYIKVPDLLKKIKCKKSRIYNTVHGRRHLKLFTNSYSVGHPVRDASCTNSDNKYTVQTWT